MIIDHPRAEQESGLRRLWREAFGDSEAFLDIFWQTAYSSDRCRCVTMNGECAAALYWFDCQWNGAPLAYIYAVATGKAYRGQGLCHRLMEDTHRHLAARGYAGAVLVPGEESLFRFYERMGYRICSGVQTLTCAAATEPQELHEIGCEEYALCRRALLPYGGVVQEGENLTFLARQARFYACDGLVLAARREGEELIGIELLGDLTRAPAVLSVLGCTRGTFRTPGDEIPFGMYLPLADDAPPPPAYFGLAFD